MKVEEVEVMIWSLVVSGFALCVYMKHCRKVNCRVVSGRVLKVHRVMISLGGCFGDRIKSRPGMY